MRSTLAGFPVEKIRMLLSVLQNLTVNDVITRQGVSLPFEKNFFFEPTKSLEKCSQLVLGHLGVKVLKGGN